MGVEVDEISEEISIIKAEQDVYIPVGLAICLPFLAPLGCTTGIATRSISTAIPTCYASVSLSVSPQAHAALQGALNAVAISPA